MRDTETPQLTGRHVLVVEDEYYLADDLRRALEGLGVRVAGPVATQAAAIAHVTGGASVDFAILDINLRGEMAFLVADALAERGVPFVFATGYEPGTVPARHAGVAIWRKPFDPAALAQALPGLAPHD